jgi:hypothetical protein
LKKAFFYLFNNKMKELDVHLHTDDYGIYCDGDYVGKLQESRKGHFVVYNKKRSYFDDKSQKKLDKLFETDYYEQRKNPKSARTPKRVPLERASAKPDQSAEGQDGRRYKSTKLDKTIKSGKDRYAWRIKEKAEKKRKPSRVPDENPRDHMGAKMKGHDGNMYEAKKSPQGYARWYKVKE